jgi:hypothetical protein
MGINENDALQHYNKVQEIITKIISDLDWIQLSRDLCILDNPAIPEQDLANIECEVSYRKIKLENGFQIATEGAAWTSTLLLMSWLLQNFKNKTENGHCRNKAHEHPCKLGSNFHHGLYTKCLKSLRDIIELVEKDSPKLVT